MDEIDYKAVSAKLATQLAEQIYQTAQWQNLAENVISERDLLKSKVDEMSKPDVKNEDVA